MSYNIVILGCVLEIEFTHTELFDFAENLREIIF